LVEDRGSGIIEIRSFNFINQGVRTPVEAPFCSVVNRLLLSGVTKKVNAHPLGVLFIIGTEPIIKRIVKINAFLMYDKFIFNI